MQILLINNEFPPIGGGAGVASYYLARELTRKGAEISILTTRANFESLPALPTSVRFFRVPGWRKSIHEAGKRGMVSFLIFASLRIMQLRLSQFDVVIYFSSVPAGLLSLLKSPRHTLMSLRGLDVPGRDPDSFGLIHDLLKPLNLQTWARASMVTACSKNLRQSARQFAPDIPIQVIYNGVDTDIFSPGDFREQPTPFRIIGASRLIHLKGFQYLLEAMRQLPADQFQLQLIGRGAYESKLRALVDRWHLGDRVTFMGYLPQTQIAQALREADIFVLPTYGDSFGNSFLEAMACGIPVIGVAAGGTTEIITAGENGILVPPHDSEAIVDAIRCLAANPALRRHLREAGLMTIRRKFSWETCGETYWTLCQQIMCAHQ